METLSGPLTYSKKCQLPAVRGEGKGEQANEIIVQQDQKLIVPKYSHLVISSGET